LPLKSKPAGTLPKPMILPPVVDVVLNQASAEKALWLLVLLETTRPSTPLTAMAVGSPVIGPGCA
jgi:hypothetical protein